MGGVVPFSPGQPPQKSLRNYDLQLLTAFVGYHHSLRRTALAACVLADQLPARKYDSNQGRSNDECDKLQCGDGSDVTSLITRSPAHWFACTLAVGPDGEAFWRI
jgi:hypothetical protein